MANFAARLIPGVAVILCVVTCSESPVPIEKPAEARIDTRLVGTWISTPDDESGRTRVRIVPFDDHQLLAELMEADFVDGGYAVKRALFRVLVSNVEGSTWISAMALAESGPEFDEMEDYPVWHIARLEIEESGGILFTELSDSVDLEDIGTLNAEDVREKPGKM